MAGLFPGMAIYFDKILSGEVLQPASIKYSKLII
jgi:hypothetical protein